MDQPCWLNQNILSKIKIREGTNKREIEKERAQERGHKEPRHTRKKRSTMEFAGAM
jgi:hypothetical protein